ncbi:MAG: phosphatidylserine decarboxylase family protein [Planctomycetes bacterium]|nr:phosphatidylserine decarboxylase family protein [Planctomycetota bacterium]
MRIPFARYGYRELIIFSALFGALAALTVCLVWWPLAAIFVVPLCIVVWFFRDPPRSVPAEKDAVVAPADGRITDITEVDDAEFIGGPATRIGIFLSILSVHINRAPCAGRVSYIKYRKGKFIAAMRPGASSDNEANSVGMVLPDRNDEKILVKQITGAIARRIVCACREGDMLDRGQKFGMIKFGSRTELFVPRTLRFEPAVGVGQKVWAGASILGRFRLQPQDQPGG